MTSESPNQPVARLTTILMLSRPAHLPTIVSNCLAGWWLGGGGNTQQLSFVIGGALLVFLGGAFLNDAFDVAFDRHHRRTRPVPSRTISLRSVWKAGLILLLAGALVLQWPGRVTAALSLALVLSVILHNMLHRLLPSGPVTLGVCRFLLYMIGASVAVHGITGWALWCGLAIALCTAGHQAITRSNPARRPPLWSLALVLSPAAMAAIMNTGPYIPSTLIFAAAFLAWTAYAILPALLPFPRWLKPRPGLLLPAIVLADMLAACVTPYLPWHAPRDMQDLTLTFLALFLVTLAVHYAENYINRCNPPPQG
jgi:hypothetical protein